MPIHTQKLDPHQNASNLHEVSYRNALSLFKEASVRVPAYADFLDKNGVNPKQVHSIEDFQQLPTISKENYFSQYSPAELSWDYSFINSQYISTSSGSSGTPFFWPRGVIHDKTVGEMFQHLFADIIDSRNGSTLCIISLAFGQWIAGFEFYNAICRVRDAGSRITIVTSGIEATDVINKTKDLGSMFDRLVIVGYPPFVKDIVEIGSTKGINWQQLNVHLLTAGEPFTEKWRSHVLDLLGRQQIQSINNIYGMSEVGMMAHETPKSILLRREGDLNVYTQVVNTEQITSLYQYYPTTRYIEATSNSSLLLTANADFPLIRYETRDLGGTFSLDDARADHVQALNELAVQYGIDLKQWQLPFVYLYGRKDFSVTLYGLNIYTENIKMSLDDFVNADALSGLFTMEVTHNEHMDQCLTLTIEMDREQVPDKQFAQKVSAALVDGLCRHNSEYAKLHSSLGFKTQPKVALVSFGELDTIRGKKHKWVKQV